jgi:hypothetical protein
MFDQYLRRILLKNSDILRQSKLSINTILDTKKTLNLIGGSKLSIEYNKKSFIFEESPIDENYYILYSTNDLECVSVIISKEYKYAEIHGIANYKTCFHETNQKVGSELLKITLNMLKKYKSKFDINMIILTDNSIKKCNDKNIKLSIMLTLLTGDTWYCKYGFRPVKFENNKYIIDEIDNELYEKNKKKINKLKITDVNLLKYIKKSNNENFINATERVIKEYPEILLKTFLLRILFNYDKGCENFEKFYEKLYYKIRIYDPYRKLYGLII